MGPAAPVDRLSDREQVEEQIGGLKGSSYRITSPHDPDYNCVSWALGDTARRWSPGLGPRDHWPEDLQAWPSITVFVKLFERYGYARCESAEFEPGVEKVAIFVNSLGEPTHMARQMQGGKWTSKLGDSVDIEHDELDAVACKLLGWVEVVMSRHNPDAEPERPVGLILP